MELRDYQIELSDKGTSILQKYGIVYYAIQMRVGKTLIALRTAMKVEACNVLFITKKKAIASIQSDYDSIGFPFNLTITNYEQVGKLDPMYDLVIIDEAHSLGAFPKPSLRTKNIKKLVGHTDVIYLSGTPTPESWSQIYHQLWVSDFSPFKKWKSFYKWANDFVSVKQKRMKGYYINDYSKANQDLVKKYTDHLFVTYTQKQANFDGVIKERIEKVKVNPKLDKLLHILLNDRVYYFRTSSSVILAETSVKLQSKIHQVCSGTVIDEDMNKVVLDHSKAKHIRDKYGDKKVAVFYVYTGEAIALRDILGDKIVDTPEEFNEMQSPCIYISQVKSGAMGINLSTADLLIYYNIMFSSTDYQQSRARTQTQAKDEDSEVVWLFSDLEKSIEQKIYKAVQKKQDYTTYYFKKDYKL